MSDIAETIAEYLSMGGLFNPEMMEHDAVRNLIIECRAEITRLRNENERLREVEEHLRGFIVSLRAESWRLHDALTDIANSPWSGDINIGYVAMRDIARAALKKNSDE